MSKGCGTFLYRNCDGDVLCGSYMSGGIMLCSKCKDDANIGEGNWR